VRDVTQYNAAYVRPKPPVTSKSSTPPNQLLAAWPEIPQLDHVSRTGATKLVTLSMGGNNIGFPSILADCIYIAKIGKGGGYGCAKRDDAALQNRCQR
jgi:hypothetical protein